MPSDTTTSFGTGTPRHEHDAELARGACLGRYVVIDRIGRGGMGTVYAAWDPDLGRRVAVKLLHLQRPDDEHRLLAEARTLASVRHPNIVAVHDVGRIDDRAFLAMEFVESETLASWLEGPHALAVRMRVMQQVGLGIAALHRAGVVHGDIKPANVLVEITEHGPVARVIDFGLARREPVMSTKTSSVEDDTFRGGTPAYMPPELRAGERPDTRSDVWSLAMTWIEVLTGVRPQDDAALRVPSRLRPVLQRALARDPEARWSDAQALLEGFERVARRQRRLLAGAGGTIVVLSAVAGISFTRPPACDGGPTVLAQTWNDGAWAQLGLEYDEVAERARAHVDAWAKRWTAVYRDACELTRRGERSPLWLDDAMLCLQRHRRGLDALLDSAQSLDSRARWSLVDATAQLPNAEECLTPRRFTAADETVEAVTREVSEAGALQRFGRFEDAHRAAERAYARASEAGDEALVALARLEQGGLALARGRLEEARPLLREAFASAVREDDHQTAGMALLHSMLIAADMGADLESVQLLSQLAEPYIERVDGHNLRSYRATNLGVSALRLGANADAKSSCLRGVELLDPADPRFAADRVSGLACAANAAIYSGERDEALRLIEDIERTLKRHYGPDHPKLASADHLRAELHAASGEVEDAMKRWESALARETRSFGRRSDAAARMMMNLAGPVEDLGDHARAMALREEALGIFETLHGPAHLDAITTRLNKGGSLLAHDPARAQSLLEQALEQLPAQGHEKFRTGILANLGMAHVVQGRPEEGRPHLAEAVRLLEQTYGASHPALPDPLMMLADVELETRRYAEALPILERIRGLYPSNDATPPRMAFDLAIRFVEVYANLGAKRSEAINELRIAEALLPKLEGDVTQDRRDLATWRRRLGVPRSRRGK